MRSSNRAAAPQPDKKKGPTEPFWKLAPDVWRLMTPQPWVLAGGFALMIFNRVSGLVLPWTSKYFIDGVMVRHRTDLLKPLVAIVFGAAILQGLTSFSLTQLISKAAQRMIAELRKRVQAHVARLPISYYDSNKTGQLVSRIMSDVEGVRNLIGTGMIDFFGGILTAIVSFAFLVHISRMLTLVALTVLVVFGSGLRKAFAVIRPIFRERPKITAEVTGRLTESLGGVRVVKGYHAESREEAVFGAGVKRLLDNVVKTLTATSLMSLISTSLYGIVSALVMYYGGREALSAHPMTAGVFVQYTMFLGMVVAPVFQIVAIGTQISEAMAGLERTRDLLREVPEEADPKRTLAIGPIRGEIEFENVSFGYDAAKMVLNEVSFVSQPGTVTALVGPSGAGKSTIIGLIAAFYTPNAGRVLVDGFDLSTVKLSSYRTQLGVVLQETFLFDGTIRENVAFSRPNATGEEVMQACRIARVDEFAEKFDGKYDTIIGERGVKLSGGQRQRVSIARALLADPRILILDEATSSLDSESEALIQEGLAQLMRGRTTFVIAHRLSTIRRAEQILVVEEGRIVECGTHASLYKLGGRYYEMYTRQHGLMENLFLAPGEEPEEPKEAETVARVGNLGEAEPTLSDAFGVKPVNTSSS
ncbi:MAG TPA: ABC transporter ATP-binding protein [Candidatus Acidoferrales bacterium]|nr:ABC transporter ATP-binding protein [Candidatus Acidoferrales bacterium]